MHNLAKRRGPLSILMAAAALLPSVAAATPPPTPKLIVVIAVDQFSADLFAQYRSLFTEGLKRLSNGIVFPAAYQSHAATETCPGHSTILTGSRPARTGIIANSWFDVHLDRPDQRVYCAEDESIAGSSSENYTVSPVHLKVPTLGERLKSVDPRTRIVSIAGKDRAAVMMGGHAPDQIWWWKGRGFVSYADRRPTPAVQRVNVRAEAEIGRAAPSPPLPPACQARVQAIRVGQEKEVGTRLPPREAGDSTAYRTSPSFDAETLALAAGLTDEMKLGHGPGTDVLAIGLSATDYVGHGFGTEGPEMCLQLMRLDRQIGLLLAKLEERKVPFVVALTADHGGHDAPERNQVRAAPDAQRAMDGLDPGSLSEAVAADLGLEGFLFTGDGPAGDLYVSASVPKDKRDSVIAAARKRLLAQSQVAAVFTRGELGAAAKPLLPPDEWSLLDRAAASFDPARSGDLVVLLRPHVTPAPDTGATIATHGSPWDYDRRVPLLFWWPGVTGFEQPLPVETVDIAPTLGSLVNLQIPPGEMDGRCLDLIAGAENNCPR